MTLSCLGYSQMTLGWLLVMSNKVRPPALPFERTLQTDNQFPRCFFLPPVHSLGPSVPLRAYLARFNSLDAVPELTRPDVSQQPIFLTTSHMAFAVRPPKATDYLGPNLTLNLFLISHQVIGTRLLKAFAPRFAGMNSSSAESEPLSVRPSVPILPLVSLYKVFADFCR